MLSLAILHRTTGRAAVEGSESVFVVRAVDEQGAPLVGRLRLAPADWSERVRLGAVSDLLRAIPESGLTMRVPAGRYRAFVSRGPEWSIAQTEIALEPKARLERRVLLTHQVSLAGYRGADLHVHTERSMDAHERGGVGAQDLAAEGVTLAAVTDHNVIGGLGPEIDSVAGAEVTTWAPEVGHFNAFPLRKLPSYRNTTPERLFRELREDPRVFVQINHPRLEDHISYFALGGFDGRGFSQPGFSLAADGIEVFNGYHIGQTDQVRRLLGEYRRYIAQGNRLTATGGSDSHSARKHPPGYPRTYVRAESGTELAPALKRGAAFVSNGPLVSITAQGKGPGDTVDVDARGHLEVEITVLAPDWLELEEISLWADDERVWSHELPSMRARRHKPLTFRTTIRVNARRARSLSAVVDGGRGLELLLGRRDVVPFAFTNPLYLRPAQPTQRASR
ncbi:MAG: CehA/McbA family metallohydrolase [Myxococcales bacterium]